MACHLYCSISCDHGRLKLGIFLLSCLLNYSSSREWQQGKEFPHANCACDTCLISRKTDSNDWKKKTEKHKWSCHLNQIPVAFRKHKCTSIRSSCYCSIINNNDIWCHAKKKSPWKIYVTTKMKLTNGKPFAFIMTKLNHIFGVCFFVGAILFMLVLHQLFLWRKEFS